MCEVSRQSVAQEIGMTCDNERIEKKVPEKKSKKFAIK